LLYKNKQRNTGFNRLLMLSIASASLLMTACSDDDPAIGVNDTELLSLVTAAGLTGDPTTGRTLPAITDAKAKLGKKLFFSKGLGGDNDSACVTCHHPSLGGGDDLSLSIGVGAETPDLLGPGRFHSMDAAHYEGDPPVPRNAPTTFNIALWDQALFHDGRVESLGKTAGVNGNDGSGIRTPDSDFGVADPDAGNTLVAAQSRFPITSTEEMRGFIFQAGTSNAELRDALVAKLTATGWGNHFAMAFGDASITHQRMAEAIGEYQRSQIFVDSPWKAYAEGNKTAISESAKRGATMFFSSIKDGGANCTSCHAGDFFTDEQYHVLATPQIGRGKGNNNGTLSNDDFGRFRESKVAADMYRFRTPTLLNVEVTGPWSHAGAYTTLENMVRHMLNPADAIANYDFNQLDDNIKVSDMLTNTQFALNQLEANRTNKVSGVHQIVEFTEDDVSDLVEFLKTLTDPCVKDRNCLAPWIAEGAGNGPDGLKLEAIDNTGALL